MKTFQVLTSGKPIFFFEVEAEYADDDASERNVEIARNLAELLGLPARGREFTPQLISKLPLVVADQEPDHAQPELKAWISPKFR